VTPPLSLLSDSTVALVAAWFSDTVHALEEFPPSVDGVQETDITCTCAGATRFSVLVNEAPPALAVTTAV
jgi:hypothetical protein